MRRRVDVTPPRLGHAALTGGHQGRPVKGSTGMSRNWDAVGSRSSARSRFSGPERCWCSCGQRAAAASTGPRPGRHDQAAGRQALLHQVAGEEVRPVPQGDPWHVRRRRETSQRRKKHLDELFLRGDTHVGPDRALHRKRWVRFQQDARATAAAPNADPGNLCVFETQNVNVSTRLIYNGLGSFGLASPFGANVEITSNAAGQVYVYGTWAVRPMGLSKSRVPTTSDSHLWGASRSLRTF